MTGLTGSSPYGANEKESIMQYDPSERFGCPFGCFYNPSPKIL